LSYASRFIDAIIVEVALVEATCCIELLVDTSLVCSEIAESNPFTLILIGLVFFSY